MQQSKSIIKSLLLGVAALVLVSCNFEPSLQGYYVENQESANFMTADLPPSLVSLDDIDLTEEQKDAYKSIDRLSFLGYKIDETNKDGFDLEFSKVKTILSNAEYIDLAEFSSNGTKFMVKYIGDDDVAEEIVVLGSSIDVGFGVVRVLGDDLSPGKIALLISTIQNGNFDQSKVEGIMNFFK